MSDVLYFEWVRSVRMVVPAVPMACVEMWISSEGKIDEASVPVLAVVVRLVEVYVREKRSDRDHRDCPRQAPTARALREEGYSLDHREEDYDYLIQNYEFGPMRSRDPELRSPHSRLIFFPAAESGPSDSQRQDAERILRMNYEADQSSKKPMPENQ